MTDQCEQMLKICNEFVRLQVSHDEYLCMKVLLLLSTGNGARHSEITAELLKPQEMQYVAVTSQICLSNTDRDEQRQDIYYKLAVN